MGFRSFLVTAAMAALGTAADARRPTFAVSVGELGGSHPTQVLLRRVLEEEVTRTLGAAPTPATSWVLQGNVTHVSHTERATEGWVSCEVSVVVVESGVLRALLSGRGRVVRSRENSTLPAREHLRASGDLEAALRAAVRGALRPLPALLLRRGPTQTQVAQPN